jgi:hypothetical protein
MSATWIAFVTALAVFEPEFRRPINLLFGALGGAALIAGGFAAASRVRPLSTREGSERLRLLGGALALGVLIGIVNLAANLGLASLDPGILQLLVERFARIPPWTSMLAGPVVEEVLFRLCLLSAVAIGVAKFQENPRVVFWTALTVSALVFGMMHILRPTPESVRLAWVYGTGVTLKSTLGGFVLGWMFWRWGLGYAIAGHFAANAAHLLLEPLVFG